MEYVARLWGALIGLYQVAVSGGIVGCALTLGGGWVLYRQGQKMAGTPRVLRGEHRLGGYFEVHEDIPAVPGTAPGLIGSIVSSILKLVGLLAMLVGMFAISTVLMHS